MKMLNNNFQAGTIFPKNQISRGPNFLGTKKIGVQMILGTILALAIISEHKLCVETTYLHTAVILSCD